MPATRVDELKNFPFPTFASFRDAYAKHEIESGIDRSHAISIATQGPWTSGDRRLEIRLLLLGPWLIWIGALGYALIARRWLLAAGVPATALFWTLSSPTARHILPVLRYGVWLVVLVWNLAARNSALAVLCGGLLASISLDDLRSEMALKEVHTQASHNEETLCSLWDAGILSIRFSNGDRYWKEWKIVGGKHIEHGS